MTSAAMFVALPRRFRALSAMCQGVVQTHSDSFEKAAEIRSSCRIRERSACGQRCDEMIGEGALTR